MGILTILTMKLLIPSLQIYQQPFHDLFSLLSSAQLINYQSKNIYQSMKNNQFEIAQHQISFTTPNNQQFLGNTQESRKRIIEALNEKDQVKAKKIYEKYLDQLGEYRGLGAEVVFIAEMAMEYFYFQLTAQGESEIEQERKLLKKAEKLPRLFSSWNKIKQNLILATAALQLQIKCLLTLRNRTTLNDLFQLQKIVRQLAMMHPASKNYCKSVMTIITHLIIHRLNSSASALDKIIQFCSMFIREMQSHPQLLTLDIKVAILYNSLKTLMGMKTVTKKAEESLFRLYEALQVKAVFIYEEHLLHLFFIIKGFIFKKGKAMQGIQNQAESDEEEGEMIGQGVAQKLSIWTSVSLDQTSLALQQTTRSLIRHRVASLATIIQLKLSLPKFCLQFLSMMHDGPFNNQAQTIKLCFQLFQARDYQRLNACLQVVLSSPSCKHLRERQVLLSMCRLFTGHYLRDKEGALMYAKQTYFKGGNSFTTYWISIFRSGLIIRLILAIDKPLSIRSLNSLKASIKINPKSYLTQYCLGKLLLRMGDLEGAHSHAKESIMSDRGQWMSYSLLACTYFCQRKYSKALTHMDELLKKYKQVKKYFIISEPTLKLIRYCWKYSMMKKLKQLEIQDRIFINQLEKKLSKIKGPANLLKYCQVYHQLASGMVVTPFDQNYFFSLPALQQLAGYDGNFCFRVSGGGRRTTLLQIIPLLIQAGQIYIAENLLKNLPSSPQKIYQMALLHQSKGEKQKAIAEYQAVLSQQPYHTPSLINLSLLVEDLGDALHYIDIAEKISSDQKLWMAKGMLFSRLGRISEAHEFFLKEGGVGWIEMQPDLTFF